MVTSNYLLRFSLVLWAQYEKSAGRLISSDLGNYHRRWAPTERAALCSFISHCISSVNYLVFCLFDVIYPMDWSRRKPFDSLKPQISLMLSWRIELVKLSTSVFNNSSWTHKRMGNHSSGNQKKCEVTSQHCAFIDFISFRLIILQCLCVKFALYPWFASSCTWNDFCMYVCQMVRIGKQGL